MLNSLDISWFAYSWWLHFCNLNTACNVVNTHLGHFLRIPFRKPYQLLLFLLHLYQPIFQYQLHAIHLFTSEDQKCTVAYFLYNWDFSRCGWCCSGLSLELSFVDFPISHLFNLFITLKSFWGSGSKTTLTHHFQSKLESMGSSSHLSNGYNLPNT